MKLFDNIRLKAGVWARERKERAEERKAQALNSVKAHHDSHFWLLTLPGTMILFAGGVEVVWAILFCIEATGHAQLHVEWAAGTIVPAVSKWDFAFSSDVLLLLALMAATVPIVIWSMVWLPVQMKARGQGKWRRVTMIGAGLLCNALVIVSGTVVMNANRQEQVRSGLVVEQSAAQGRAALTARRDAIQARWATLTAPSNTTLQAQAARAGVAGWDSYITTARSQLQAGTISQQRFDLIERARGSAVAAEAYQHDMDNLAGQIAAAAPEAATAAHVQDEVGSGMDSFAEHVKVYRPPFVALCCTVLGIFGAWWMIGMIEAMNSHSVASSGWADEAHRIEDHSHEAPLPVDPAGPVPPKQQRRVYNPETGREEVFVQPKGHWRPTGKKRKTADGHIAEEMEIVPEIQPSERGVEVDGGDRIGSARADGDQPQNEQRPVESAEIDAAPTSPLAQHSEEQPNGNADLQHVEQPEPPAEIEIADDDTLLAFGEPVEPEASIDAPDADVQHEPADDNDQRNEHVELPDGEGIVILEDEQREPETRADRLLAAAK